MPLRLEFPTLTRAALSETCPSGRRFAKTKNSCRRSTGVFRSESGIVVPRGGFLVAAGLFHEKVTGTLVCVIRIGDHAPRLIWCGIHRTIRGLVPICMVVVLARVPPATMVPAQFLMIRRAIPEPGVVGDRAGLPIEVAPALIGVVTSCVSEISARCIGGRSHGGFIPVFADLVGVQVVFDDPFDFSVQG